MKIRTIAAAALVAAMGCGMAGCETSADVGGVPALIENVNVTLAPGQTFASAVTQAATRRRWVPQQQANGTIRCTLTQREHLVIVDVVPTGPQSFSIRLVQRNIPVRKYNQWANNLSREIVARAAAQ